MIFVGADATGFEEDARLTAMWLWTISTTESGQNGKETEEGSTEQVINMGSLNLEYDAVRKIAQGLGAHLENLVSLVEIKGEMARLLPVSERARFLFGKEDSESSRRKKKQSQLSLFDALDEAEREEGWDRSTPQLGNTILDRIHQSMILFATERGQALKRFLIEGGVGTDSRFWSLAQALSALYPVGTDEKRWVDGVLARKRGLGL